ncbi:hypothetical protein [Burkholderia anthina]|uniref:hypothetical protein n=1 Tax=Burkholderia anthina TaxID=179879 RepID=UPI00158CD1EB|nr:hypothetical protein [Burkholderia anthina]
MGSIISLWVKTGRPSKRSCGISHAVGNAAATRRQIARSEIERQIKAGATTDATCQTILIRTVARNFQEMAQIY